MRFQPNTDFVGTFELSYEVEDSNGAPVLDSSGEPAVFKANFEIKAVNDKPVRIDTTSLSIRLNQAQSEDDPAVSLNLGSLDYLPGPATATDEANQTVTYSLTLDTAVGNQSLGELQLADNSPVDFSESYTIEAFGSFSSKLPQSRMAISYSH